MERRVPVPACEARCLPDGIPSGQGSRRRSDLEAHDSRSAGLSRMSASATESPRPIDSAGDVGRHRGSGLRTRDRRIPDHTVARDLLNADGTPRLESTVSPGLPLQVICYERADGAGIRSVGRGHARARNPRQLSRSRPGTDSDGGPGVRARSSSTCSIPVGASRRSLRLRMADSLIRALSRVAALARSARWNCHSLPKFMRKHDGLVLSLGQFNQWVSEQVAEFRSGSGVAGNASERAADRIRMRLTEFGWRIRASVSTESRAKDSGRVWMSAPR